MAVNNSRRLAIEESLRTLRITTWLGWQIESNWTDPLMFFIFAILRPLSAAMILVLMYTVVTGVEKGPLFQYIYVSNAFFVIVVHTMADMAWAIFEDRENYRMLRYMYTSPAGKYSYLIGRAMGKLSTGLITMVVILLTGYLFLGIEIVFSWEKLLLFLLTFPLGICALLSLGIIVAGVALSVSRNGEFIGEIVAGMTLLVSSAYFPPDVLPKALQYLSLAMPTTYWLEAMRRSVSPPSIAEASKLLSSFSNLELILIHVVAALILPFLAVFLYSRFETAAREKGIFDRVSGY